MISLKGDFLEPLLNFIFGILARILRGANFSASDIVVIGAGCALIIWLHTLRSRLLNADRDEARRIARHGLGAVLWVISFGWLALLFFLAAKNGNAH